MLSTKENYLTLSKCHPLQYYQTFGYHASWELRGGQAHEKNNWEAQQFQSSYHKPDSQVALTQALV